MRDIIFRGKRLDNGLWIEGSLRQYPNGRAGICCKKIHYLFLVDPATVGQFTGLKDKNGKPIFEGDIVEAVLLETTSQRGFVWPIMPVVFRNAVFGLLNHRDEVTPFASFAPRVVFEVKGNIHDNPELLKEDAT